MNDIINKKLHLLLRYLSERSSPLANSIDSKALSNFF